MKTAYFDGNIISENLHKNQPVFHYTSPESFLSILNNKELWFSDSQFMNDRSEYVYIKNIYNQAKNEIDGTRNDKDNLKFADYILEPSYGEIIPKYPQNGEKLFGVGFERTRYYLFCTSLNYDNHSLWNYYVKNNNYQGYNIGITVNELIDSFPKRENWKLTHGPVNYDKDNQITQLQNKIIELDEQYDKKNQIGFDEDVCIDHYQSQLSEYLKKRSIFYKNPVFGHEEEYRFVIEAPSFSENDEAFDYHVGNSGLIVPHIKVKFHPENAVKEIRLAPMMEREVAKQGVESLLKSKLDNKKSKISVGFSKIDVRY